MPPLKYFIIVTDISNNFRDCVPVTTFIDGELEMNADEVFNIEEDMKFVAGPMKNGYWFGGLVAECQIYKVM